MICRHPSSSGLHLQSANSLSVRHSNLFTCPSQPWRGAWLSRGVNGIDGTIGTAIGLAQVLGPLRLLSGDSALVHDAAALPALAESGAPVHILILNNGGGRIFDTLKASTSEGASARMQHFLRTPQQVDPVALARACGIRGERVDSLDGLDAALRWPVDGPSLSEIALGDSGPAPGAEAAESGLCR